MRKVSGPSPDGAQDKKERRNSARSLGNMEEKRGEGMRLRSRESAKRIGEKNRRKEARDVARQGAQSNPLLFIR